MKAKGGSAYVNTVTFGQALNAIARRARKRAKQKPAAPPRGKVKMPEFKLPE